MLVEIPMPVSGFIHRNVHFGGKLRFPETVTMLLDVPDMMFPLAIIEPLVPSLTSIRHFSTDRSIASPTRSNNGDSVPK